MSASGHCGTEEVMETVRHCGIVKDGFIWVNRVRRYRKWRKQCIPEQDMPDMFTEHQRSWSRDLRKEESWLEECFGWNVEARDYEPFLFAQSPFPWVPGN